MGEGQEAFLTAALRGRHELEAGAAADGADELQVEHRGEAGDELPAAATGCLEEEGPTGLPGADVRDARLARVRLAGRTIRILVHGDGDVRVEGCGAEPSEDHRMQAGFADG